MLTTQTPNVKLSNQNDLLTVNTSEKALLSGNTVESVVSFTKSPKITAEANSLEFASWNSLLADLGNAELNRGMIVWWDQAVCSIALAWDKHIDDIASFVLHS